MDADLARVEIPVRWEDGPPGEHPGRALNAWFHGELTRRDSALADRLRERREPQPFSLALLPPRRGEDPARQTLRIAAYGELAPCVRPIALAVDRLLLGGRCLLRCNDPATFSARWQDMAAQWLLGDGRVRPVRLSFLTPATFGSRGCALPLPVPEQLFGGLLDRWHAAASIDLGAGARDAVAGCSAVRAYRLWTRSQRVQGRHAGCLGWAEFTLVRPDRAFAGLLALLGAFAEYSGVGQKTGAGFGAVSCDARPAIGRRRPQRPGARAR